MEKEFWLWLNPETFIWKNSDEALVFNSGKGNGFLIPLSQVLSSIIERLINPEQMYCSEVIPVEVRDKLTGAFIDKVVKTGCGGICERVEGNPKPVVMFPKLNVQRSVERQSKISGTYRDDKIMLDLFEVTICFNGIGDKKKRGWNRQFIYPPVTNESLNSNILLKQLEAASGSNGLRSVNLLASDFSGIESIIEIVDSLSRLNATRTLWCRIADLKDQSAKVISRLCKGSFGLIIIVDPVANSEGSGRSIDDVICDFPEATWRFIISGESDYEMAAGIIESLGSPVEAQFVPLFTGENLDFFIEHVFIQPADLLESGLTKREIFAHQAVNTFDFGKVSLMPDGRFYANLNHPPIGKLDESLKEVLYRELFSGKSWRRIRDEKPCTECLYRWLCPSPSGYELVIGRPDLCLIGEMTKSV